MRRCVRLCYFSYSTLLDVNMRSSDDQFFINAAWNSYIPVSRSVALLHDSLVIFNTFLLTVSSVLAPGGRKNVVSSMHCPLFFLIFHRLAGAQPQLVPRFVLSIPGAISFSIDCIFFLLFVSLMVY